MPHPPRHHQRRVAPVRLSALLLAVAAAGQAHAGSCTVSSTGLAFGTYQPLTFAGKLVSRDADSMATVSLVCQNIQTGGAYTVALGPSVVGSGNRVSTRYLANTSGGDFMAFNVYTDANRTTVWGDGATGGLMSGSIPTGDSNQSKPVYGRIPAGQNTLKAGSFSGSLTMTLTYNP
jgi:spore coat protein U-like protein